MTHFELSERDFTDADWLAYLGGLDIPHLNEWMRSQALRGQDYYLRRLDALGFAGGSVLDAGCGVGNWALALAQRFKHVEAIDSDALRVGVLTGIATRIKGSITTQVGSVTDLPFPDSCFDAVFCNGVVFLTDTSIALKEFTRVLRSGGMLYVTYNGPDWWRHLIRDRGPTEPVCYTYGANGLITWAFRLAGELDQSAVTGPERDALNSAESPEQIGTVLRSILTRITSTGKGAKWSKDLLNCLNDLSIPEIELAYNERMMADLKSRILTGAPDHEVLAHTYTHRPEDMTVELASQGYLDILSAREGGLCLNRGALPVDPIYSPHLGVFETLAQKS